ncbi:class I SAM-dependent methyltransferase [Amycolatopsis rubida]|uniref:Methyltransferase domain-containing protein n=1 Tax=Amycolatopsis rubida TaxID=112413 RepID=A0A1I5KGI9_9PSEU|nr:class I SAM-dependent methyltransferase [Amycolatopsis rubida]SFO84087.1 Methyltransferase domain-containing protein [Amycolatopsis rubida]
MAENKPGTAAPGGKHWNANARDWAEIQERTARPAWLAVLNELTPSPGRQLLDLGCGAGGFARLAAGRGIRVSGLDTSAALVAIARTRTSAGTFRVGDMEQIPFPDDEFSAVTAFNSLHFARDPAKVIAEAIRVTRPGGHIAIAAWDPLTDCDALAYLLDLGGLMPATPRRAQPSPDLTDPASVRRLLSHAGLTLSPGRTVECPWEYPDQETALRGLLSTGPAAVAIGHAGLARATETITESISPYRRPDGSYLLRNTCFTITATVT